MQISDKLSGIYADYYAGNLTFDKRRIAAAQTFEHIKELLPHSPYKNILDIGAGEGSLLAELDNASFAKELHAVEISDSGINTICRRNLNSLKSVSKFDGYKINGTYELGTAIHVLEHVEHERAFIEEITRACDLVYVEVPLELTLRVNRSIKLSGVYGHINFYNSTTFRNLLETSNVEIVAFKVFSNSLAYETFVSPSTGKFKYYLRSFLLWLSPTLAGFAMTYLAGAVIKRK
jgi:hypothetical protein